MTQYETSDLLRLANGHITQAAILSSSAYLVDNFTVQSDGGVINWKAYIDGGMRDGSIIQSLGGSGGLYGSLSGTITFAMFTPDMLEYLFTTVMGGLYVAPVTIYGFHPRYKEVAIQCYLRWSENIVESGTQMTDTRQVTTTLQWNRGAIVGNAYSSAYSKGYS